MGLYEINQDSSGLDNPLKLKATEDCKKDMLVVTEKKILF